MNRTDGSSWSPIGRNTLIKTANIASSGISNRLQRPDTTHRNEPHEMRKTLFGAGEVMRSLGTELGTEKIKAGTAVHLPLR